MSWHVVKGRVEIFPGPGGWRFVRVPKKYTDIFKDLGRSGLIPIIVNVGQTIWQTSLLPMGDGTQFIALKARVRKDEKLDVGDIVAIRFRLLGD